MFWAKVIEKQGQEANKLKDVSEALTKLNKTNVLVGVTDESNAREGADITNADLVYIHTHGARSKSMREDMQPDIDKGKPYSKAFDMYIQSKGSPMFAIPPRPIIEPALDSEKDFIAEMLKGALDKALNGDSAGAMQELEKTGMEAQNIVKDWFVSPDNSWAPNSPGTIRQKGSGNPLIDTGALRDAITYVVRPKEG